MNLRKSAKLFTKQLKFSKHDNNQSCSPSYKFLNEKKLGRIWSIEKKTLKVRIVLFSTFNSKLTEIFYGRLMVLWLYLKPLNSAACRKITLGTAVYMIVCGFIFSCSQCVTGMPKRRKLMIHN